MPFSFLKLKRGHTMAEMLMVVAIIALLSSMAVMRFDTQRKQSAINATKSNLESIRTAIALYYEEEKVWPSNDLSSLWNKSSPSGTVYIAAIPKEKILNSNSVVNVANYNGGWVYNSSSHDVLPNLAGSDALGALYSNY